MAKKATKLPVATSAPISQTKDALEQERRWRAEDDIRTMQRAAEIKKDPLRVKAMKSYAEQQLKAVKKC